MIHKKEKKVSLILSFLVFCIMFISLSAWNDTSQHKTNNFNIKGAKGRVVLQKFGRNEFEVDDVLEDAIFELYRVGDPDEKIGDIYKTNEFGEIVVNNLSIGDYYFLEVQPPEGYDYDFDDLGIIKEYPFSITEDNLHVLVNAYNIPIAFNLTVEKIVSNESGIPLSDVQKELDFEFKVFFDSEEKFFYRKNDDPVEYEYTSGSSLYLKHKDKIIFSNLPKGLTYRVEETPVESYRIDARETSGSLEWSRHVIFNNIFIDNSEGTVSLKKEVVNADGSDLSDEQKDKEFEFIVDFSDHMTYEYSINKGVRKNIVSGSTITLKHGEEFTIYNMPEGVTYTVTEKSYEDEDYYSEIKVIEGTMGKSASHEYTVNNIYKPEFNEDEFGGLLIRKEVINSDKEDTFIFTVNFESDEGIEYRINEGEWTSFTNDEEFRITQNEVLEFRNIPLGTTYRVTELSKLGYHAQVKAYEGKVLLQDTILELVFKNEFITDEETLSITINKIVSGIDTDKEFNFILKYEDVEEKFTLKHGESVTFNIPKGVHYEVIEEDYRLNGYVTIMTNGSGMTLDRDIIVDVYNDYNFELEKIKIKGEKTWVVGDYSDLELPEYITLQIFANDQLVDEVKVKPAEDGTWTYELTLPKYDQYREEIVYTIKELPVEGFESVIDGYNISNTYMNPVTFTPRVKKEVVGNPKDDRDFTFTIAPTNLSPIQDLTSVILHGSEESEFAAITYTKPGVYTYVISEVLEHVEGYEYDMKSVLLTVTVVLEGNDLVISEVVYHKEGHDDRNDLALFVNKFNAEPEKPIDPENPVDPETPKKPEKPGKPTTPEQGKPPVTGISVTLWMYVMMILIALLTFVMTYKTQLKKKHNL